MCNERHVERTAERKGFRIDVVLDPDPVNPCEDFDMFGHMVCWHSRYNLGHEQPKESPEEWLRQQLGAPWEDERSVGQLLEAFEKDHLVLPLYLYDHSGITISTADFNDQWDSGQVGWIYVSHDGIRKEYSLRRLSQKALARAKDLLKAEVDTYDDYLTGMVYGYEVKDQDGDVLESCWGYFGYPEGVHQAMQDAEGMADALAKKAKVPA